jgi:hypothetical protein
MKSRLRITFLAFAIFLTGCGALTEPEKTKEILEAQGYSHVEITGYRWVTCGEDTFATGFRAISPAGIKVSGAVCSGWMKGHTIRFDG